MQCVRCCGLRIVFIASNNTSISFPLQCVRRCGLRTAVLHPTAHHHRCLAMHDFFSIGLLVLIGLCFFYRLETSAPGLSGYYWYCMMYPKRPTGFQKRPLSGGFTFTHLLEKKWLPKIDGSFMSLLSHLPFWPWNHIPKRNHSFHYLRLWLMMLTSRKYISSPPKWRDQHVFRKETHYEYGLEVRQLQKNECE